MAKKIKISRKQIRQPDEFLSWSEQAWEWAEEHVWELMGAIAVGIVLILLVQGVAVWVRGKSDAPARTLAEAQLILRKPVNPQTDDNIIPGMDQGFNSEQDKLESAAASFEKVVKDYPDTTEGSLAILYLATTYENMEQYDKAFDYYSKFQATKVASLQPELQNAALMGKARCLHQQGDFDAETQILDKIIAADSIFTVDAKIALARIKATRRDDPEAATQILEDLKKDHPDSWTARDARFLPGFWKQVRAEQKLEEFTPGESMTEGAEESTAPAQE